MNGTAKQVSPTPLRGAAVLPGRGVQARPLLVVKGAGGVGSNPASTGSFLGGKAVRINRARCLAAGNAAGCTNGEIRNSGSRLMSVPPWVFRGHLYLAAPWIEA
jgi:hypothetical protein